MKEVNIRKNRSGRRKIKESWSRVSRIILYIFLYMDACYLCYMYICVYNNVYNRHN